MLENLVEKLTDYGTKEDKTEDAIDEMYGVAVVFDEDEDKDAQLDEVQDEAAGSDDEQPMLDTAKDGANLSAMEGSEVGSAETVKPSDVDAFWLQRVLNKHYNDADISQVYT